MNIAKEEKEKQNLNIIWRRLDLPGHEAVRLLFQDSFWHLNGTAVFSYNQQPCKLDYGIICNSQWRTVSGAVRGWVGNNRVETEITVDVDQNWRLDGKEIPEVGGCIDIDLNFSPSTNLLPIRRLNLNVGEEATVRAAWLRFPRFNLEPLEQLYRRIGHTTYHYESAGGRFITDITVNDSGFPTLYPNLWESEL
jgi:uncharacterized protein